MCESDELPNPTYEGKVQRVFQFEHTLPVLDHLADCKVVARFIDGDTDVSEVLWAHRLNSGYVLCSIPAFAYGLALGDTVDVDAQNRIRAVIGRSGRSVFRIWSEIGWINQMDVLHEVARLGGIMEECTAGLTAIDAQDNACGWDIWEYLEAMQDHGDLEYETGHWAGGEDRN